MRRTARLAAAVLVVAVLVVLPAAPAAAVTPAAASAPLAPPPDFTPSGNKWRQWMVNLLSSVMGAATPSGFRAEQIANGFIYDHGAWEQMNARFGIDGVRLDESGNMIGYRRSSIGSGTYTDVVIDGLEQQYKEAAAKGKGPVRAPATPLKTLGKVVGGAVSVIGAYEIGALLGGAGTNLVGSWIGFDANSTVCGAQGFDNDVQRWIFRSMAGQNCDLWDYEHTYVPDPDMGMTLAGVGVSQFVDVGGPATAYCGPATYPSGHKWYVFITGVTGGTPIEKKPSHFAFNAMKAACGGGDPNVASFYNPHTVIKVEKTVTGQPTVVVLPEYNELPQELGCKVAYTDGTSATSWSAPYLSTSEGMQQPQCPETPDGKTPESVQVIQQNEDGTNPATVYDEDVTDEYAEWWEQYPECQTGACKLDLIRLAPTPAVSCFDLEDGCVDWHTDPDKTSKYLCRYGVHDVDLAECNVYAGLFQPGRVTTGSPYSDPSTGAWSGGQNAPKTGQSAMQRTIQDPESLRNCDFPDFAVDPVSWVLRPLQCFAEWVAIPRPAVVEVHMAAMDESWRGSMPGQYAVALGGLGGAFATLGAGNCGGINVSVPVPGPDGSPSSMGGNLLGSCPGSPLAPLATGVFWILSGMIVWLGVLGLRRMLDRFVGF